MRTEARATNVLRAPVDVRLDEALQWYEREGRRFSELVRRMPDGSRTTAGLEWTLAETAVHVLDVLRHYREAILGRLEAPSSLVERPTAFIAEQNARAIAAEPERRPAELARMIDDALTDILTSIRASGPAAVATLDAGHTLDMPSLACGHIGEFLIHGYDIARTLRVAWPIERRPAVLAVHGASAAMPLAFDADAAGDIELNVHVRLRGGEAFAIRVGDRTVWAETPRGRPDVTMSADPVAYLLVGFGRQPLWRPVLQGKIVGWGRRPGVLIKLPRLFLNP